MKKKLFIGLTGVVAIAAAVCVTLTSVNRSSTSDLMSKNVEALTQNESNEEWRNGRSMGTVLVWRNVSLGIVVGKEPSGSIGWSIDRIFCCKPATDRDRCNAAGEDSDCINVIG